MKSQLQKTQTGGVAKLKEIVAYSLNRQASITNYKDFGPLRLANKINTELNLVKKYSASTIYRLKNTTKQIGTKLTSTDLRLIQDMCKINFLWNEQENKPYSYDEICQIIGIGKQEPNSKVTADLIIEQIKSLDDWTKRKILAEISKMLLEQSESETSSARSKPSPTRLAAMILHCLKELDLSQEQIEQSLEKSVSNGMYDLTPSRFRDLLNGAAPINQEIWDLHTILDPEGEIFTILDWRQAASEVSAHLVKVSTRRHIDRQAV